jgi:flagellar hook capping protein FlgD/beta-propeller uncharacterized protein DUF5122
VNATTGNLSPWDPICNGSVSSISYVPGGIFTVAFLIVGGDFTYIGGQFQNYMAALDPATASSAGLTPPSYPNGPVHSVYVDPLPPGYGGYNEVFLGGDFTSVAGQPRNRIASFAAFGQVTSWNPDATGVVEAIVKVGNTVYLGGAFGGVGGQTRSGIAAIDPSGMPTGWAPNADMAVTSLLEGAGTLYAGGLFTSIAETPHSHFAGMGQVVTAVESGPAPGVTPMALRAAPNPFDRSTTIQFSLPSNGDATVSVYDVCGRRVRELHRGWLSSGRHTMSWDGHEDSGRPVAAGVYFLGVRTNAGSVGSKIYRLK